MNKLISCEFNIDIACVELKFADGSMISIDCIAVEDGAAKNVYQRSELDYLVYNDPVGHVDLIPQWHSLYSPLITPAYNYGCIYQKVLL